MKTLSRYIKANNLPLISLEEKLKVNKDLKSINDGNYEMPNGNTTKLDKIVIDALNYDVENETCILRTSDAASKVKLDEFERVLDLYLGSYDLRGNNYERKNAILNLTKHVIEEKFDNECSVYVFFQNQKVKKIYDELDDDNFFDLFKKHINKSSDATYRYYIGNDVAMMTYDRDKDLIDWDVFIVSNYIKLS